MSISLLYSESVAPSDGMLTSEAIVNFHVKMERDEDGFFVASVPALPGCHSDGETETEARQNIREAIELWLEAEDAKAIRALPQSEQSDLITVGPAFSAEAA